ncbi:MAG: DUF480 domain-containing protein [Micropruina sp.]|uniref:DUF480 domain-containing protein n=1 Tax=Micropruina sp. TaxID=2737536 RepID=UPI0039E70A88
MALPVLDATEQRILGSLLEKQRTVPTSYPLSLNGLRVACNQTSSREPVTDFDDSTIETAARELKARGLLRIVWAGKGSRTLKYHQLLDEVLSLQPDERALITVLLLRGAQAPGELKTRAERLHPFADRDSVEQVLRRMAALPEPLVRELERRGGQQDRRWIHLLGPVPEPVGPVATPSGVDREVVLADGAGVRDQRVRDAYDHLAEAYFARLGDELTDRPFDVWLLERVATLAGSGPIVDVGCGPGHIAAFLADTGATVSGIDLSPAMVAVASREFPDLDFQVGTLFTLLKPRTASGWGAVVAWYSLVHLAGSELAPAVAALARTLAPGGVLAVAVHAGDEVRRVTELAGEPVELDVVLHDQTQLLAAFAAAGLNEIEWYRRGPSGDETATERLYVLGGRA